LAIGPERLRQAVLGSPTPKMKISHILLVALVCPVVAYAVDVGGAWKAEFDTQVGLQKYTYTFKQDGAAVTGTASADVGGEKHEVVLKDVKLDGDNLSFTELVEFQGNEILVTYRGKVGADQIAFTREVGDFATEQLTAKRQDPEAPAAAAATQPRPGMRPLPPIVLGPDDKAIYPPAPAGFDEPRVGIAHGREEMVEYDSKTVGTRRKMLVYTPPGYTPGVRYPVVYLLHGIGGDETEWQRFVRPDVILDNLLADKAVVPMIAVFPNGRAEKNDRAEGDIFSHFKAFENFEGDLLHDVIPYIDAHYSTLADSRHRALAGLSMGGGQSLNFGLTHLDTFAWIGAFSPAPNTKAPDVLVPDPGLVRRKLLLLWLSCGNKDQLIYINQGMHAFMKANGVPHIWQVDSNAHDTPEWKNSLYLFSQKIFRE
jgi:enterochelin esterase-like enzyme